MRTEQKSHCVGIFGFSKSGAAIAEPLLFCFGCARGYKNRYIAVDHFVGFAERSRFVTMNTLRLKNREKIFAIALSYKFLCLDIECVIPYCWVNWKYACEVYWKPWLLCSCNYAVTLIFPCFIAILMVSNTGLTGLLWAGLIGNHTVVVPLTGTIHPVSYVYRKYLSTHLEFDLCA